MERCPECKKDKIIKDERAGDIVCQNCGLIIQEKTIAEFNKKEFLIPGKHSFYNKYFFGFDEKGEEVYPKMIASIKRLKLWFTPKNYEEKRFSLVVALLEEFLREVSPEFRCTPIFKENFRRGLKKTLEEEIRVNNWKSFLAAFFCLLYKEEGNPNPINEVSKIIGVSKKKIFKNYQVLLGFLNKNIERKIKASSLASFLATVSKKAYIPLAVEANFLQTFPKIYKNEIFMGKSRKGLMAGLLFYFFKKDQGYMTLDRLVSATGVSGMTIKKRCKNIISLNKLSKL